MTQSVCPNRFLAWPKTFLLVLVVSPLFAVAAPANEGEAFRRPVAIELNGSQSSLLAANRDSGSLTLVDVAQKKVVHELSVGKSLVAVELLDGADSFAAASFFSHEIVGVEIQPEGNETRLNETWRIDSVQYPTAMSASPDRSSFAIAGLWSRQIQLLGGFESKTGKYQDEKRIDLTFCPGQIRWLSADRVLVADAFGDRLAVINAKTFQVISGQFKGHRTGGILVSPDGKWVAVSDQKLNPLARSNRNDVHWGLMVFNQVRWLAAEQFLSADTDQALSGLRKGFDNQPVGEPENAKGDLGAMAMASNGAVVLAVGGTNEIAIGNRLDDGFAFVRVGRRPVDVAIHRDGSFCYVANQFDDTVSIVDVDDFEVVETISLGKRPQESLVRKGEALFYDATLSHDGWMSCHSCHVEGHSNGSLNDNFSDASFQTPKRVMSLLGKSKETLPLAWNGQHQSFEDQVRASIEKTMQSDDKADEQDVTAIAAFIQQLPAPPSVSQARGNIDSASVQRGKNLFGGLKCVRCHAPPSYTTPDVYAVGVEDENGETEFNPPSLVGLGQRDQYFHDGRYKKLQDLFSKFEHQLPRDLTEQELSDLIDFLKSL